MNTLKNSLLIGAITAALGLAACDRSPPPQATVAPAPETLPAAPPPPRNADVVPADAVAVDEAPVASIADRAERRDSTPVAAARFDEPEPTYAQVISVKPLRDSRSASRQECRDVEVVRRAPVKDEDRIAGTAIGAVVGGLVGNQVGGGRGRDLATVAGAVGGGIAGRKIQENQQNRRTVTAVEQRCKTVKGDVDSNAIVAYDIVYSYGGQSHEARIDHDPGDRIALPVRSID